MKEENSEKIDIILATYNGGKYLKQQLDSILNQTYNNFKLIISDDASTDETIDILKEYKKKDNRIEVYYQEKNLGYVQNFEFLLKKVENDIFMLCDQDDIWLKEKIEKSYLNLKSKNVDLIHCDLKVIDNALNIIHKSRWDYFQLRKKINYDDLRTEYLYNCITGCTIMAKKSFLKYILPLPKKSKYLIHDYWLALVISLKGKIGHIDEPLILYRQHDNNQIGTTKTSLKMNDFDDVRNLFINVKLELFEEYLRKKELFTNKQQEFNEKSLKYYINLKNKKYINLKNINIFHKLYKYDNKKYYILQFFILNIPILSRIGFKIYKKKSR